MFMPCFKRGCEAFFSLYKCYVNNGVILQSLSKRELHRKKLFQKKHKYQIKTSEFDNDISNSQIHVASLRARIQKILSEGVQFFVLVDEGLRGGWIQIAL